MRFSERQIVLILEGSCGDVSAIRQRRGKSGPTKLVHECQSGDVRRETEPVRADKVLIHAAIVGVCCCSLRVRKGETSDWTGAAGTSDTRASRIGSNRR